MEHTASTKPSSAPPPDRRPGEADGSASLTKIASDARGLLAYFAEHCAPFDDPEVEEAYQRYVLVCMFSLDNLGCVVTMGVSCIYHVGVLSVRYMNKGINEYDDYMFLLRLAFILFLWVVLLMTPRFTESQRYSLSKILKWVLYGRTALFLGEVLLADMHMERVKMVSIISTCSFVVSAATFDEYVRYTGLVAFASPVSRLIIYRDPMPWASEAESILFSIGLYGIGLALFAVLHVQSRTRFLRYYARRVHEHERKRD